MFSDDEDQDSLFGSPPPSPQQTCRPVSPPLALPGGGISGSRSSKSTAPSQNVGTIALPGSQPDSELPINPLALSLNHGIVQRPPAQISTAFNAFASTSNTSWHLNVPRSAASITTHGPLTNHAGPSTLRPTPTTSTTSAALTAVPVVKKSKKKTKKPSTEITQERVGPEFELPDPSAPPPSHWLRNQQNLLGKAGVVAGVKPSTLVHTRGATQANPILIDDEEDRPTIGRRAPSQDRSQLFIDPSLLMVPTTQEIVSVLIAQKDIFPILEGVLKLILGGASAALAPRPPPLTGFERRSHETNASALVPPPVKKRKLNRVPAGATDWDVPYPFPQGEGPDAYQKNWERERGKQLVWQLIKLIKTAARKAATKKYLLHQKAMQAEEDRLSINKQPSQPQGAVSEILQDASNSSRIAGQSASTQSSNSLSSSSTSTSHINTTQTQAYTSPLSHNQSTDAFFASSFSQPQQTDLLSHIDCNSSQTPLNIFSTTGSDTQNPNPSTTTNSQSDPPSLDSWMNFLVNNFPTAFDNQSNQTFDFSSTPSESQSQSSTPAPDDFAFTNLFGAGTIDGTMSTNQDDLAAMLSLFSQDGQMNTYNTSSSSVDDSMIDPSLLMLNYGTTDVDNWANINTAVDSSNARLASPMTSSSSSLSGNGPATPASTEWETSMPEVYGGGGNGEGTSEGMWRSTMWGGFPPMTYPGLSSVGWQRDNGVDVDTQDFGLLPDIQDLESYKSAAVDKGKDKAVEITEPAITSTPVLATTATSLTAATVSQGPLFPPLFVAPTPATTSTETCASSRAILEKLALVAGKGSPPLATASTGPQSARKVKKDAIIKRAREKRDLLLGELNDVKMKLWESTVEQAGLLQLLRQVQEASVTSTLTSNTMSVSE